MTPSNRGATGLKSRRRAAAPMREFDRLPAELRAWLAGAILPWSPRSVRRAYRRALLRTRDPELAIQELDRLERTRLAGDAANTWGAGHPAAQI